MTEETRKKPNTPNLFANQGQPTFAKRRTGAQKTWAIICTIGFGVFWVAGLFFVAELFGERDLTVWPMVLTLLGFGVGMLGRIMMTRESG